MTCVDGDAANGFYLMLRPCPARPDATSALGAWAARYSPGYSANDRGHRTVPFEPEFFLFCVSYPICGQRPREII